MFSWPVPSGIQTFAADSQSGALRIVAPTVTTGVSSPVAMAVTADYANLYLANRGDGTIVHFAIGLNGVLTKKDSVTFSGTPISLAVNTAGTYLYVVGTCTSTGASICPQALLSIYPLSSGTIGSLAGSNALVVAGFTSDTISPNRRNRAGQ